MSKLLLVIPSLLLLVGCTSFKDNFKVGDCYAIKDINGVGCILIVNDDSIVFDLGYGGYVVFNESGLVKVPNEWCGGINK